MRIDVVSIFPAYFDPLRLSLVGKAIETGLVELGIHDLREWTHDRHRTVDDTRTAAAPAWSCAQSPGARCWTASPPRVRARCWTASPPRYGRGAGQPRPLGTGEAWSRQSNADRADAVGPPLQSADRTATGGSGSSDLRLRPIRGHRRTRRRLCRYPHAGGWSSASATTCWPAGKSQHSSSSKRWSGSSPEFSATRSR